MSHRTILTVTSLLPAGVALGYRKIKSGTRSALGRFTHARLRRRSLPWPDRPRRTTLVIAPHPDDESLGCGGLIAHRTAAGEVVTVVFITDGSASHPGHPECTPATLSMIRTGEARVATGILGVPGTNLHFLGAPDGKLPHLVNEDRLGLVLRIRDLVESTGADEVLVTSRHDGSTEHVAASSIVHDALAGLSGPRPRLLEYLVWSRWSPRFVGPALSTPARVHRHPLSPAELALKRNAIHVYRSQIEPLAPWHEPVLPDGFARMFNGPEEFFFEF
jgi:LmbE family N-acetylglucosaminyl deacetylase